MYRLYLFHLMYSYLLTYCSALSLHCLPVSPGKIFKKICHFFPFFLYSLSFFFFFIFFFLLVLFVNVHFISMLLSICPNNFFFFSSQNFSYDYFFSFETSDHSNFFELNQFFIHLGSSSTIFILFYNQ